MRRTKAYSGYQYDSQSSARALREASSDVPRAARTLLQFVVAKRLSPTGTYAASRRSGIECDRCWKKRQERVGSGSSSSASCHLHVGGFGVKNQMDASSAAGSCCPVCDLTVGSFPASSKCSCTFR